MTQNNNLVDSLLAVPHGDGRPLANSETVESWRSEYFGHLEEYGKLSDSRSENSLQGISQSRAERRVLFAIVGAQASIRTNTVHWDELMSRVTSGETDWSDALRETTDGKLKSEKLEHILEHYDEIVEPTANALRLGMTRKAREYLIGRADEQTVDHTGETYLRATKANFVCWLLGYDTWCIDHRIHSQMAHVALRLFTATEVSRFDVTNGKVKNHHVNEKPHDVTEVEFWHDTLKWNPDAYDRLAGHFVQAVADKTEIPADRVTQVLFRTSGPTDIIHTVIHKLSDI